MNYRIVKLGTRKPLDALELHVMAKAYYAAWQCVHGSAPVHEHIMPRLGLLIDYGPPAPAVQGTSLPCD
jgi:hypothetical protein